MTDLAKLTDAEVAERANRAATAVYLATSEDVANDLSSILREAARRLAAKDAALIEGLGRNVECNEPETCFGDGGLGLCGKCRWKARAVLAYLSSGKPTP